MKVLFVYRGYGPELKNSVIEAQAASLIETGIDLTAYKIPSGGINYIRHAYILRNYLKKNRFDIVHGHFSYSSIIAAIANCKKTVSSLMGSDVNDINILIKLIINFFANFIWSATIVKTEAMKNKIKKAIVVPNGINLELFKPIDRKLSFQETGFDSTKKNIIFVAEDINSKVKNYPLAREAQKLLNDTRIQFHAISGIKQEKLVYYYNAADLLLLTSLSEGSPNVIKEAMACNCPIVSTDVGSVKELINDVSCSYLTSLDPNDVAEKMKLVLDKNKRSNGRQKIKHLDDKIIASQIIQIYKQVLSQN